MTDDKIKVISVMNGVSSFLPPLFVFLYENAYSNERPEHSDVIKRKEFVPSDVMFNEKEAALLFSCLLIDASFFMASS